MNKRIITFFVVMLIDISRFSIFTNETARAAEEDEVVIMIQLMSGYGLMNFLYF